MSEDIKNSNNDVLFFKVFRNIFIKRKILSSIKDTNTFKNINYNSIISLDWMIKNNQYPMIIDKLNNKDIIIHITKESINSLIINIDSNNNKNENEIKIILELIYNKSKEKQGIDGDLEFKSIDFIKESVILDSIISLKLFLQLYGEEYIIDKWYTKKDWSVNNSSGGNYESLLDIAISNGSLKVADYLLGNDNLNWYNKSRIVDGLITKCKDKYNNGILDYHQNYESKYDFYFYQQKEIDTELYNKATKLFKSNSLAYKIMEHRYQKKNKQNQDCLDIDRVIERSFSKNKSPFTYYNKIFDYVQLKLGFELDQLMFSMIINPKYYSKYQNLNFTIDNLTNCILVICIDRGTIKCDNYELSRFLNQERSKIVTKNALKENQFRWGVEFYSELLFKCNRYVTILTIGFENLPYYRSGMMIECLYRLVFIHFSIDNFKVLISFKKQFPDIFEGSKDHKDDVAEFKFTATHGNLVIQSNETLVNFFDYITNDDILASNDIHSIDIPWPKMFITLINNYPYESLELLLLKFTTFETQFAKWIESGYQIDWCSNLKTGILDTRFIDLLYLKSIPNLSSNGSGSSSGSNIIEKVKLINHLVSLDQLAHNFKLLDLLDKLFNDGTLEVNETIQVYKELDKDKIKHVISNSLENCLFENIVLNKIFKNHNENEVLIQIFTTVYGSGGVDGIKELSNKPFNNPIELINHLISSGLLLSFGNSITISIIYRLIKEIKKHVYQIPKEIEIVSFLKSLKMSDISETVIIDLLDICSINDYLVVFNYLFFIYDHGTTSTAASENDNNKQIVYNTINELNQDLKMVKECYINELSQASERLRNNAITKLFLLGKFKIIFNYFASNGFTIDSLFHNSFIWGIYRFLIHSVHDIDIIDGCYKNIFKLVVDQHDKQIPFHVYEILASHRIDMAIYLNKQLNVPIDYRLVSTYPNSIKTQMGIQSPLPTPTSNNTTTTRNSLTDPINYNKSGFVNWVLSFFK